MSSLPSYDFTELVQILSDLLKSLLDLGGVSTRLIMWAFRGLIPPALIQLISTATLIVIGIVFLNMLKGKLFLLLAIWLAISGAISINIFGLLDSALRYLGLFGR